MGNHHAEADGGCGSQGKEGAPAQTFGRPPFFPLPVVPQVLKLLPVILSPPETLANIPQPAIPLPEVGVGQNVVPAGVDELACIALLC